MASNKSLETVVSSAARTTSGASSVIGASQADQLRFFLNITAASGTSPTLNITVEDTPNGTDFYQVAAFTQKTAAGKDDIDITTLFSDSMRVSWAIAGTTPSFTFSLDLLRVEHS